MHASSPGDHAEIRERAASPAHAHSRPDAAGVAIPREPQPRWMTCGDSHPRRARARSTPPRLRLQAVDVLVLPARGRLAKARFACCRAETTAPPRRPSLVVTS